MNTQKKSCKFGASLPWAVAAALFVALLIGLNFDRPSAAAAQDDNESVAVDMAVLPEKKKRSKGVEPRKIMPVAILSSSVFDATTIDPATVTFAGAPVLERGDGTFSARSEDVNEDGLDDLVVEFRVKGLQVGAEPQKVAFSGPTAARPSKAPIARSRPGSLVAEGSSRRPTGAGQPTGRLPHRASRDAPKTLMP